MLEIIWRLRAKVLNDEAELRALIAAVVALPGMNATHYDLNRKGQWRRYELTHTVVDALTQRTQLLVMHDQGVEDERTRPQAMIALGKHGEQPTVIVRVPDTPGAARQMIERWDGLYEAIELESTFITSAARRIALTDAGLDLPAISGALAMGWAPGSIPSGLRRLERAKYECTPIAVDKLSTHWRVDFGLAPVDGAEIAPGTPYSAALSDLNERLLQG
ncbi:hypothetical protein [Bradymonas sediminis]|nr:hypothetical protein [Bradymonas sediminis]TDP77178.1 hypothetical protein DFR33_10174 [Bradymonas sediminis]